MLKPGFEFKQHGQCGRWVSSLLPHLAARVDDMAFLMAMVSRTNVHGPGSYLMKTGFLLPGFPCFGAWVSYALGCETDNLPAFVVLPDPKGLPYNQKGNFSSGFLPVTHQGTVINASGPEPLAHLRAPSAQKYITPDAERDGLANDLKGRIGPIDSSAGTLPADIENFRGTNITYGGITNALGGMNPLDESCGRECGKLNAEIEHQILDDAVCSAADSLKGACASCKSGAAPAARPTIGTTTRA